MNNALTPLKTLQETMDGYIKNDTMRPVIMKILALLKEQNQDQSKYPQVINRQANSKSVGISFGVQGATIHVTERGFEVEFELTRMQFAEPFYYELSAGDEVAEEVVYRIL